MAVSFNAADFVFSNEEDKAQFVTAIEQFNVLNDILPGAVLSINVDTELDIYYANKYFYKMLQYTSEEFEYKFLNKLNQIIFEDDLIGLLSYINDDSVFFNCRCRVWNGENILRWITFHVIKERSDGDKLVLHCFLIDDTDTVNMVNELDISRRELEGIAYSTPGSISKMVYKNGEISYLFLSSGLQTLAGYSFEDPEYTSIYEMVAPEDREPTLASIKEQLDHSGFTVIYRVLNKDKSYRWVKENASLLDVRDDTYTFICVYTDITSVKQLQIDSEVEMERLRLMLSVSNDVHFKYNIADDVISLYDRKLEPLQKPVSWDVTDYIESDEIKRIIHPDYVDTFKEYINGKRNGGFDMLMKADYHREYTWHSLFTTEIKAEDGTTKEVVGIMRDIHAQKIAEMELGEYSMRDLLTGVYNREAVETLIVQALEEDRIKNGALILFDINDFKLVNENMGSAYANNMLRNLADRMKSFFPETAICGRIGGDEFLVYMSEYASEATVLGYIEDVIDGFTSIYKTAKLKSAISLSVGVKYILPAEKDYYSIIKKADIAATRSKQRKKNVAIYNDQMGLALDKDRGKRYKQIANAPVTNMESNSTIMEILNLLVFSKDTPAAIETVLGIVGQKYEIDRVYVYEMSIDNRTFNKTYEWCKEGVTLKIDKIKNESGLSHQLSYENMFDESGIFYCDDITRVRHWRSVYDDWLDQNVTSLMQFSVVDQGEFRAFIGFDFVNVIRTWQEDEMREIASIVGILSTYVLKLNTRSIQETDHFLSEHITQHIGMFVYIVDPETYEIKYTVNGIKGFKQDARPGKFCYKVIKGMDSPCVDCPINVLSPENNQVHDRIYDVETNRWMDLNASIIYTTNNKFDAVFSMYDVTQYVEKISDTDNLVACPTLSKFEKIAQGILAANLFKQYRLIHLDISNFRVINDTYGYSTGDHVIIETANAISSLISPADCYGRISADKFIILMERIDTNDTETVCNEMLNNISEYVFGKMQESVSRRHLIYTAGVYNVQFNTQNIAVMIDKAHMARKSIPQNVKMNTCSIFDVNMAERQSKNNIIEANMEIALQTHEFRVFLQPKYDVKSKKLIGCEALVRWITHDGVTIYPDEFIPLFEQNGFIINLDYYVYEESFKLLRRWIDLGYGPVPISINVSRAHINDDDFIINIFTMAQKYDLPLEMIELELTESMFYGNQQRLVEVMSQLRELGFVISIDDFGSGYSSFNLLKDLSFDILKLDKSFFRKSLLGTEEILVRTIVNLAHELKMDVIAEGVETAEQVSFLGEISCDYAQGYYFARPMPAGEFESLYYKKYEGSPS